MRAWKKAKGLFYRIFLSRFRTRLFLSYLPILFLPVMFLSFRFSYISQGALSDQASKNAYEIIKKDNEIMDAKLSKVQENSLSMTIDQDLFNIFNDDRTGNQHNVLEMDRKITKIIAKYFAQSPEVLSTQIVTSYYTFGTNTSVISGDSYTKSTLYKQALAASGKLVWIPTYDYTYMFDNTMLQNVSGLKDRYILSAVRLLNCSYIDDWVFAQLPDSVERPVLIVNFQESFFSDNIQDSIPAKGAIYCVTTPDGHILSHSDKALVGSDRAAPWLDYAVKAGSGTYTQLIDGRSMIVCFDTSKVTGWISAVIIPKSELMSGIAQAVNQSILYIALLFMLVSLMLSLLLSVQISRPISRLMAVIKKMEQGKFSDRVTPTSRDELGLLTRQFNTMNEKIGILIEENYLTKIREKESEIMALNLQLNPHFIYNTLNVINWMAIEAGNENISNATMDLCNMLEKSFRNKQDLIPLQADLDWLKSYLNIMAYRYEGKFRIEQEYDPGLALCLVPKLFLQPFVENAIYHGFQNMDQGGVIRITARLKGDDAVFTVEDNGAGIEQERIAEIVNREQSHIGVSNVDKRIKLLFGMKYGVTLASAPDKGTVVTIILPFVPAGQADNPPQVP